MLLIFTIAGLAAIAVVTYNRLRDRDPDGATRTVGGVRQLAAVVLVCARAIEAVLDALQTAGRGLSPATGPPNSHRAYGWPGDEEEDRDDW